MSSGGIAPYNSVKRLTEVNLMPAMNKEARDLVKDVEIFGTDPLTALEQAAKKTPLDLLRDFLGGSFHDPLDGTKFLQQCFSSGRSDAWDQIQA